MYVDEFVYFIGIQSESYIYVKVLRHVGQINALPIRVRQNLQMLRVWKRLWKDAPTQSTH